MVGELGTEEVEATEWRGAVEGDAPVGGGRPVTAATAAAAAAATGLVVDMVGGGGVWAWVWVEVGGLWVGWVRSGAGGCSGLLGTENAAGPVPLAEPVAEPVDEAEADLPARAGWGGRVG